jgi:hypothetical protein
MNGRHQGLFFTFMTESRRLPIGGIANFRPNIAIVTKSLSAMEELPSTKVRYEYFKLPSYAT